ncbi:hypothetical protein [Microvirga arsenatis]|uniref:YbgF trimerisation domain-containing protein n=1 Tax=Microvirga arsenatis TaxID=2692265 RepID=A0ABW9YUR9_9HYPH|nr:hypothetical protein [Microvirga arsenatis]NBJ11934.1 hypothetical protein [Microvirga arsenatis]NBJ24046.1 hypothetical protein [Microvirga arsenatis]
MRLALAAAMVSSLLLPLAVPAEAQTRLPRVSPAERKTKTINRQIQQDQRLLRLEERIQMENNQIRQSIERDRLFAPRPLPPMPRG